jgi:hypothetical protein
MTSSIRPSLVDDPSVGRFNASSFQTQIDCCVYYVIALGELVGLGEIEEGLPNRSAITLYISNS